MLKMVDMTDVLQKRNPELAKGYVRYFVQRDVYDFHVFRILEGDYDGNSGVYTVEREEIHKSAVLERMQVDIGKMDIREAFTYLDEYTAFLHVLAVDVEAGFENQEYKVADTLEEALNYVTEEGHYSYDIYLYEDVETPDEEETKGLHLCPSLRYMKVLLEELKTDPRSHLFEKVAVRPYQNGREQGYALIYQDRNNGKKQAITFSQEGRSEAIVVYHGEATDRSTSDEAYGNSRAFSHRHYNRTMAYIFELLENHAVRKQPEAENQKEKTSFVLAKGLQVAESVLYQLMQRKKKEGDWVSVECLQDTNIDGYSLYFLSQKGQTETIGITGDDQSVRLLVGKSYFQGVDPNHETYQFPISETELVVSRIIELLEEKQSKSA